MQSITRAFGPPMEMKVAAAAGRLGLTLGDCRGTACRTLCAWEGRRPTGYGKPYPYNATFEGAKPGEARVCFWLRLRRAVDSRTNSWYR
jgi:hypothetical protein